ncbi:Muniscin C-terminal mu homology domain-containing protein [Gorgonomyces haynaldii]|nr:Muniscin C-terminal mu homology domain-containing protein [Gorgonomyces haynaldii]
MHGRLLRVLDRSRVFSFSGLVPHFAAMFLEHFDLDKPKESLDQCLKRLRAGYTLDEEISQFFKERAQVEYNYATELGKLAKRTLSDKTDPESTTFNLIWNQFLNQLQEQSNARLQYAKELVEKVEMVIKQRSDKDPDWSKFKQGLGPLTANFENQFQKATKDYAEKLAKLEKPEKGWKWGNKSEKMERRVRDLEQLRQTWIPEANKQFQNYELMDLSRLEVLKKAFGDAIDSEQVMLTKINSTNPELVGLATKFDPVEDMALFCRTRGTQQMQETVQLASGPTPLVDEEGFSIRPETTDLFKLPEPEDRDSQTSKLKVELKSNAIEQDKQTEEDALRSLTMKLKSSEVQTKRMVRNRTGSSMRSSFANSFNSADDKQSPVEKTSFSVTETINVLQVNGNTDKLLVVGEIAAHLASQLDGGSQTVHLKHQGTIGKIIPNSEFVEQVDQTTFTINFDALKKYAGKHLTLFKYQVTSESAIPQVPIVLKPVWKLSETTADLVVIYQINSSLLKDTELNVQCSFEDGGDIGNVQTLPTALWDLDERAVLWQVSGQTGPVQKLAARIETSALIKPMPVMVTFTGHALVSGLEIETQAHLDVHHVFQSGHFGAQSVIIASTTEN